MALRFRKRIKIAPGIRLNISGSGISTTVGPRGASVNIGKKGTYLNTGIPGTGLYSRTKLSGAKQKAATPAPKQAITARTPPPEPTVGEMFFGIVGVSAIPALIVWAVWNGSAAFITFLIVMTLLGLSFLISPSKTK